MIDLGVYLSYVIRSRRKLVTRSKMGINPAQARKLLNLVVRAVELQKTANISPFIF